MWYKVFVPGPLLLIPVLIMTTKGTQTKNDTSNPSSDVIVKYSAHAEAADLPVLIVTERSTESTFISTAKYYYSTPEREVPRKESSDVEYMEDAVENSPQEDVVFVPNEREVERNVDYLEHNNYNLNDIVAGQKTVGDVLAARNIKLTTETANTDIIFVMGKNIENADEATTTKSRKYAYYDESIYPDQMNTKPTKKPKKLDCTNLSCNNDIESVCGGKVENNQWRFRLFLNDCYFRKVNCNFRMAINRYKEVPLDNCNNLVHHTKDRPFSFRPEPKLKPVQVDNTRRSISSRRSMAMNTDGKFCDHSCPTSCPEHYAPECAATPSGNRRVFINHCALDYNSCFFGVAWHKRPLAECVGGKIADMRQNAGFIGWMQRVGIVDKKGRLVLE